MDSSIDFFGCSVNFGNLLIQLISHEKKKGKEKKKKKKGETQKKKTENLSSFIFKTHASCKWFFGVSLRSCHAS